jgi:hypothetical protein
MDKGISNMKYLNEPYEELEEKEEETVTSKKDLAYKITKSSLLFRFQ